jgi:hypothetical protein
MLGWIIQISIISILLIMIFHYSQFCFKSVSSFKNTNLVDLKVQKYKNIISSLTFKKEEPVEDMGSELAEYLKICSTNKTQIQLDVIDDTVFDLPIQKNINNNDINKEPSFLVASSEHIQIEVDEI